MRRPLLAACLCTLLSGAALNAQMYLGAPAGAMPLLPPPTQIPGCGPMAALESPTPAAPAVPAPPPVQPDPTTTGPQVAGKALARAVATVTALPWLDDLAAARLVAAATGKPVLWLQALGELDGFA